MFHGFIDFMITAVLVVWWFGIGCMLFMNFFQPEVQSYPDVLDHIQVVLLAGILQQVKRKT